jgi:SEL1 protein
VVQGNQGSEDELIQAYIVQAKEGDVSSMVALGDLYYFGARGLPRDQPQALAYYTRAADRGNTQAMCCAAAMHLKGEGGADVNLTRSIELYEQAVAIGSAKALNGLGYLYFYGQAVPKNEVSLSHYLLMTS